MRFMNNQSGFNCNRFNSCNNSCDNSCNNSCNNNYNYNSRNNCNNYGNNCCNSCRPIPCPSTCPYPIPTPTPTPILQPTYLIANNLTGGSLATSTTGQGLPYTNVIASNGLGIGYAVGNSTISLREPGQYVVMYNVTFTYADTTTTSTATVNTYLSLNGVAQAGGNITNTITDGTTVTNSGATLINVTSASLMTPATLALNVINNQAINYSNLSISIYKLC